MCYFIFNFINLYPIKFTVQINDVEEYMIIIIFLILIEKICFNNYFYSHQTLSFFIIIILFLYFLITNIIQSKFKLFYIIFILKCYSYSFRYQIIKIYKYEILY